MKTKQVGVWLTLVILCALFTPFPPQVRAEPMKWSKIDKPGPAGNIIVSPSEVSEIAVGRRGTVYALDMETPPFHLYHSSDGGGTWDDLTPGLAAAGAGLPASKIAVAPDSVGTVAVVTNGGTAVYLSTNGGGDWMSTAVPVLSGTIQTITISRSRPYGAPGDSFREIAIGTADWGNNTTLGQVWIFQFGKLAVSWRNQNLTVDPASVAPVGGEVSAIAYSPRFQMDGTITVVASTASSDVAAGHKNKTWLCIGTRDSTANTTSWNSYSGYPVEIATPSSPSAGDAPGVAPIISSLSLPSDYSGMDGQTRRLFVSYDRTPDASDDVYRLDDATVYRLGANNGANINLGSISYHGTRSSGQLLAGEVAGSPTVQVRRTSNPLVTTPTWYTASTPPTGPGNARVSWSMEGDVAYCGTGQSPGVALDESAFSTSPDGDVWQQQSLIDTIFNVSDMVPSPDSQSLFLATTSLFGPEGIWRTASTQHGLGKYWSRQLSIKSTSNKIILRLSPNYASDYTIYVSEVGGDSMAVSHNRGNSWKLRRGPGLVVDIAVEDENTAYAFLPGGLVKKSENDAWTWSNGALTGLPNINMAVVAKKGTLLAGGKNGEVVFSTDGGATFTRLPNVDSGNVQVIADANYPQNGIIYAASVNNIYRMKLGSGRDWEPIRTIGPTQGVTGLAVSGAVLYAAWYDGVAGGSGVERCLVPTDSLTEWDTMDTGSTSLKFDTTPRSLTTSGTESGVDVWAIDTLGEILMVYEDDLATIRPMPTVPVQVESDPITGRNVRFSVSWPEISGSTEYDVGIYTDEQCTAMILSAPVTAPAIAYRPSDTARPGWVVDNGSLVSGKVYFVRLRIRNGLYNDRIRSLWSLPLKFTVAPGVRVRTQYIGTGLTSPGFGATGVALSPGFTWSPIPGAVEYELVLAMDSGLMQPVAGTPVQVRSTAWQPQTDLDYDTTYFWRVRAVVPMPGDWSPVGNFVTLAGTAFLPSWPISVPSPTPTPSPALSLSPKPSPMPLQPPTPSLVPSPKAVPSTASPAHTPLSALTAPAHILVPVIIGSVLVIVMAVMIVRRRR